MAVSSVVGPVVRSVVTTTVNSGQGGGTATPGVDNYLRPASTDKYFRPDGTSLYKRPA